MKFRVLIPALALSATPGLADPMTVHRAATALFDDMPEVEVVEDVRAVCGGGTDTNPDIGYCTSDNTIYVTQTLLDRAGGSYEMAHALGHAIQVRHGVADVALREITRRRDEEEALRGMVTRQVDCVAGVLVARAGVEPVPLRDLFENEPFAQAHWGRDPLDNGPQVSIGLDARAQWFETGATAREFAACTVGEMSADLIVAAQKG